MLSNTAASMLYYIYVFESKKDGKRYIGYTNNLRRRINEHNKKQSRATAPRTPLTLVYYEACLDKNDAKRREHYLKTTQGRRFLGLRLQEYQRKKALGSRG